MFNIPIRSIILADASMHLPLYDKILKTKGNTLSISVMTLSTFIMPYFKNKVSESLEIIYQYKEQLVNISKSNAFYSSRNDSDFLEACLNFLRWTNTYDYDLSNLSSESQKEIDLKEIIELIKDIPLKEKETQSILKELDNKIFNHVYILKKEFSDTEYIWVDFLIRHGAHYLYDEIVPKKHYLSCANARVQADIVAKTIIEEDIDADNVFVAVPNESDKQVLCQMFEHYKIPYTLLSNTKTSPLTLKFITCLKWIQNKSLSNFMELISRLYDDAYDVYKYYETFPNSFSNKHSILNLEYEENSLIDEYSFNTYKDLETKANVWISEHSYLFDWTINDIEKIINEIKEHHTALTSLDYSILMDILSLITQAKPYLKDNDDLSILINSLSNLKKSTKPESYQGVLIGSRSDITSLKDVVFVLSAHAKEFPKLSLKNGIFNEAYISKTSLPSLESRIDFQNKQIFETLSLPKELYVIVPQSTYQSKSLEQSLQMDTFMDMPTTFIPSKDHSVFKTPSFSLSSKSASSLYLKQNKFTGSVSRLESFARCPLQHFIRYGLRLSEKKEWSDIRIRGTILHHILETLSTKYGKSYADINKEQILEVIKDEFAFAKKVFPEKTNWLNIQISELASKTSLILEQLSKFESGWHMNIDKQEYKFSFSYPWNDLTIELYGFIDRIDASSTSFCIFDYKSSDKDISLKDFESGLSLQLATYTLAYQKDSSLIPAGNFYISLKTSPVSHDALSLSYRKKVPEFKVNEVDELQSSFVDGKKLKGWQYQDLSIYHDDPKIFTSKKDTPSFETLKEKYDIISESIISEILSGNIMPDHDKNACDYCAYRLICRNSRNEVEKISRIEKEDE